MPLPFKSISTQVAQALQAEIRDRMWLGPLPGERHLAERFHVSRKTIRKALAELRAAGTLTTARSRGSSVCKSSGRSRTQTSRVALLLPQPLEASRPFTVLWINRLMSLLHAAGHPLQIFHGERFYGAQAGRALARLTAAEPACCWVVGGSNRGLQEWFAGSGKPAIIAGSAHPGVTLPSVDIDHRALCRHSASLLLRHGHRRLALFLEHGGHAGDAESERGFREGIAAVTNAPEPIVCAPDRSAPSIVRELKRVLARAEPPTGCLVSNAYAYLAVVSYLASAGLQVPHDISVISRDDETFLRFLHPAPTFYSAQPARYARALHRGLQRVLAGDTSAFALRIMPDLVAGHSVGPPSVSRAQSLPQTSSS